MSDSFTGIGPLAVEFLAALADDKTKAFFDRERATNHSEIAEPAKLLVDALAIELPARPAIWDVRALAQPCAPSCAINATLSQ